MDKFSADLLEKIRSAVIKKLREMERYVDNELPDYIMILVANKRTLAHMQKDLTLFLGKHTTGFVVWLFEMITDLKKSSSSSGPPSSKPDKSKGNSEKTKSEEDVDVLDYDLGDQEEDLLDTDENSQSYKPSASVDNLKPKVRELTGSVRSEDAIGVPNLQRTAQKSAKVYPVQPMCRLSSKPTISPEQQQQPTFQPSIDEYDPTKPEFTSGMSSVVRNMRKGSSKLQARQTNKLLLRAVNDATKSIMDNKNMNRYKPTPLNMLASTKSETFGPRSHNLVSVKIDPSLNLDTNPVFSYSDPSTVNVIEQEPKMNVLQRDDYDFSIRSDNYGIENNNRTIFLSSEQSKTTTGAVFDMDENSAVDTPYQMNEYSEIDTPFQVNEYPELDTPFQINQYSEDDARFQIKNEYSEVDEEMTDVFSPVNPEQRPHFTVTLNGVDLSSFKRKFSDTEESMDAEDEYVADEEWNTNQKKQKVVELCKYWPSCMNSDDCVYHHPSIPCKSFPDCRYGNKCLYVHPNCKFDSQCSRKDCPYTHAIQKKFPLPLLAKKRPVKVQGFKPVCKFYPKCTVKNCTFIHPKLCRFGTKCRLPTCRFTHVSIPPRKQMRWKANVSEDV